MFKRRLSCSRFAAALVLAGSLVATTSAMAAGNAYDGAWSLTFVTRAGDCDPSYNFNVNVVHGRISHPNLVRFQGNISNTGRARASVGVGNKYASGTGRLAGSSGGGNWSGYSGTARCSGRWTAVRY